MPNRKIITVEVVRRVNQNRINGTLTLERTKIPDAIKMSIRKRRYTTREINESYARVMSQLK